MLHTATHSDNIYKVRAIIVSSSLSKAELQPTTYIYELCSLANVDVEKAVLSLVDRGPGCLLFIWSPSTSHR